MWSEQDDDALVEASGKGDELAFNRLVQRHAPRLHGIVRRYIGSSDDADEIVQDAFWNAWKASSRWRSGEAKFSTWLYRVAINRAIDYQRASRRRSEFTAEYVPETETDVPGAQDHYSDRQEIELIGRAIDDLPERQRLAILLSTREDKSNAQIAQIMGSSEGAIEQLLVRARRRLRETYRELT